MRQRDKILSRQKTRLNPIKSFIAPAGGWGGEGAEEHDDRVGQRDREDPAQLCETGCALCGHVL